MIRLTKKRQEDVSFVVSVCRAYYEDTGITQEEVAKALDISPGAVSKCIFIAGVKNWISFQMLSAIKTKEHYQQCKHYDEFAKSTVSDKWFENKLYPARRKYIRDSLTKEYATKVVRTYIENGSDPNVHDLLGLSAIEMNDVLIKASILRLISEEDFRVACEVSILRGGSRRHVEFIKRARKEYPYLPGEIQERERMLEHYDEVYSDADEVPSKEEIQASIEEKKARIKQIENYIVHWHDKKHD